jgi:murein L,D-transpeptidase YafK
MRGRVLLRLLFVALVCSLMVTAANAGNKPRSKVKYDNAGHPRMLATNVIIDSIAIHKADREMLVFRKSRLLKVYTVHLGIKPVGAKRCIGDYRTPEGHYFINAKNPSSKFHKSLEISYPNAVDKKRAAKIGLAPGGDIMIHGLPNGEENAGPDRYQNDWTWGCIAVSNAEIEELFEHTEVGTPLVITP